MNYYLFEEEIYWSENGLAKAVMEFYPELLDDSLVEFIEQNVEEIEDNFDEHFDCIHGF